MLGSTKLFNLELVSTHIFSLFDLMVFFFRYAAFRTCEMEAEGEDIKGTDSSCYGGWRPKCGKVSYDQLNTSDCTVWPLW